MAKGELQTRETDASVEEFLNSVLDEQQRADTLTLIETFKRVSGKEPKMWGPAIIGFGHRVLKYDSGRELDWMVSGFSPRKSALTLYVGIGGKDDGTTNYDDLLGSLGNYKTGKGCLYIKRLADVDGSVLDQLIRRSYANATKTNSPT